jgi:flagellum-specific peptidoglycan hydrolase FlgJ
MKMVSKKLIVPAAALCILSAGAFGIAHASAASSPTGQESLVQKIADTFGLDKSKVQAVFDQNKAQNQQNREAKYEQRLTQAVTAGQLTGTQKDAILTEHKKLESEMTDAMSKTGTDRRTAMEQIRTEAQTWAKDNNIDTKWLIGPGRLRGPRGMDPGMMGQGNAAAPGASSPSATPSPASQIN